MPRSKIKYRLLALDRVEGCLIDETFDTLDGLVAKHGKNLDSTRRKCLSIRQNTKLAQTKYKHIIIQELVPAGYKTYESENIKSYF